MTLRLPILFVFFSFFMLHADRVEACSGPACEPAGLVAPADGAEIPANVPALVVSTAPGQPRADHAPELLGPGDVRVDSVAALVDGRWVLTPNQPLAPETTYTLRHEGHCEDEVPGEFTSSFTTLPQAPLPTTLGELVVEAQGSGPTSVPGGSLCTQELDAAYATLRLDVDPSVTPWMPVIRWRLAVDGEQAWAETSHGRMQKRHVLERDLLRVYALCDEGAAAQALPGLALGRHTLQLQGFLPGQGAPFATAQAEIALKCAAGSSGCAAAGLGMPGAAMSALALLILRMRRRR